MRSAATKFGTLHAEVSTPGLYEDSLLSSSVSSSVGLAYLDSCESECERGLYQVGWVLVI